MSLLAIAGWLITPLVLGTLLLWRLGLRRRTDGWAFVAWALMSGALMVAVSEFLWLVPGLPIEWLPLAPTLAAVLLIAAPGRRWPAVDESPAAAKAAVRAQASAGPTAGRHAWLALAGLLLALLLAADQALLANSRVIVAGDEAAIWSPKAKALFIAGGLHDSLGPLLALERGITHADYPLLNPLLQLDVFARAGSLLDVENRWPIQLLGLVLLLATGAALRRRVGPVLTALLLLLLSFAVGRSIGAAEADLLVALGLIVAVDALDRWRAGGPPGLLGVAGLALGFLVASKHEGLLLALVVLLGCLLSAPLRSAFAAQRADLRRFLAWLSVPGVLLAGGWLFNARFDLANDLWRTEAGWLPLRALTGLVQRGGDLGAALLAALPPAEWWQPTLAVPLAALLGLASCWRVAARSQNAAARAESAAARAQSVAARAQSVAAAASPAALVVLLGLLGYLLVYAGTPRELVWHVQTSLPRLLLHLLPVALLALGERVTSTVRAESSG
ncbi:MAG: hypothetical protein ACT4PU_11410 [Planctomycetota bacterium]